MGDNERAAIAAPKSVRDVTAERLRQITREGFSADHDRQYTDDQLPVAACCYALHSTGMAGRGSDSIPASWPWDARWWKPTTRRQNLVKAAALLLAEIDRLDETHLIADLSKRLRDEALEAEFEYGGTKRHRLMHEAADEIDRLEAQLHAIGEGAGLSPEAVVARYATTAGDGESE